MTALDLEVDCRPIFLGDENGVYEVMLRLACGRIGRQDRQNLTGQRKQAASAFSRDVH